MISVRDRYVRSERSETLFPTSPAPNRDETYSRTAERAFEWMAALLSSGRHIGDITTDCTKVSIAIQEYGRNTGSLFETTFSGELGEMVNCLVLAYYFLDGRCVAPPADYPFRLPEDRQRVLEDIRGRMPLRNEIGALLARAGYQPLKLEGLYDIRGCAPAEVAIMLYAGITDPDTLTLGAGMRFRTLFETCEFIRVFGMSFDEALAHAQAQER